jgi:hypothetical protein
MAYPIHAHFNLIQINCKITIKPLETLNTVVKARAEALSVFRYLIGIFCLCLVMTGNLCAGYGESPETASDVNHGEIRFTGMTHQQYFSELGDSSESSFISRLVRLGLRGLLNDYAKIKLCGEFAGAPELLDAVLTIAPDKNWKFEDGQFRIPFGTNLFIENKIHEDIVKLSDKPREREKGKR